jgi:two-component system LytT family response regulator
MTIRTLIVDDEAPTRASLHDLCATQGDLQVVGECSSASQAIKRLCMGGVDLLLLDVQLGPLTGFDVLHEVPALRAPLVIFITAFDQHAVRAFEENALDYLLKPVGEDRFRKAVERARQQMSRGAVANMYDHLRAALVPLQRALHAASDGPNGHNRIVAERDGAFHVIDMALIEYIEVEAHSNYVAIRLVADEGSYLKRGTMQSIGALLDASQFLRIRRNCIVNLAHVARIERGTDDFAIILKTGLRLLVGRSFRHAVAEFVRTGRVGHTTPQAAAAAESQRV